MGRLHVVIRPMCQTRCISIEKLSGMVPISEPRSGNFARVNIVDIHIWQENGRIDIDHLRIVV